MGNVPQGRGFFQTFNFVLCCFSLDHLQEDLTHVQGFLFFTADDHAQHNIRRGLRNGAAIAHEGTVGNYIPVKLQLQEDVIPAAGIHPFQHNVCIG